ncbi:heterokaryon incompatibility protein-domain-containing protein, partial [Boeremia exigua]|uniref:heterokaryon incompatibility protein-domain-containing protein n=1 Tax=Boeremia exigua TaxID=749465 RepID=UPI001E8E99AF
MDITIDPSHVFAYNKLVDPRTHLRLISLEGHDKTTQIVTVSIITVPTHDVPHYHAVSYTWGERTSGEQIWMNGDRAGHLHVQANCATVLRQLHHFSTSEYYWIDAICINQSDTEEKECQVAMMGWIFMHAECVLACVG